MSELGLILIVIGIILFVVEAAEPGFFIAIPAGVLIILGIIAIAYPQILTTIWTPLIVAAVVIPLMVASIKFYQTISPPSKPKTTMSSSLIGQTGRVLQRVEPDELNGKVKIDNQVWSATADEEIDSGKKIVVVESKGVHVVVKEKKG